MELALEESLPLVLNKNIDERGIIWPLAIVPFQMLITAVSHKQHDHLQIAEEIIKN